LQTRGQGENPKLVVGIVVDQMRADYLYRYYDKYEEGGLKRLMTDGFHYKNAHFNYGPTYTGPGHAAVYSGTTPSRNGIVANNWYSRVLKRSVYCAEDTLATAVGGSGENGEISARNLMTTTFTDELRMFSNERSKVVGVAIKDRGASLPAGHNPNGAYWFDDVSGDFISSDYYMDKLPKWAADFNKKDIAQKYAGMTWETLYDLSEYVESMEDDNPYERGLIGEKPTLPYDLSQARKPLGALRSTPFGNSLTLDFALAAIEGEQLGQDEFTDVLAVSFSSTDYAGHAFGPRSIEVQDVYLRFDQEIKRLLDYLDEKIGKGEYTIFLTADHGVVDVPALLRDSNYPGGYLNLSGAGQFIGKELNDRLGEGEWIENVSNDQIYLDRQLIKEKGLNLEDVQKLVRELVLEIDAVADAYTATELMSRSMTDPFALKLQNGFNSLLSGDVMVVLKSGHLESYGPNKGTSHGAIYTYDTHIPILLFGKNIPSGSSVRPVTITDIAPTMSLYLNISLPSAATGIPLMEIFE
jgi:predicted AlkP superfamily pyrophosphatase or phosphodiesterase